MAASDDLLDLAAQQRDESTSLLNLPTQPVASDALLDGMVQENKRRTATVLDLVAPVNPDKAAEAGALAKRFKLDPETIAGRQDDFARIARIEDAQRILQASPFLRQQLQDPEFAKIAQDDVESLSALEEVLNFGANFGRSLGTGLIPKANAGLWGVAQAGADVAAGAIQPAVGTILPGNPFLEMSNRFGAMRRGQLEHAERWRGKQEGAGFVQKSVLSGAESLGLNMALIPASILSANPAPMLAGMTAVTGGDAYGEARDKGVPVLGALSFASSQGMIEFATEKLPALYLLKDIGLKKSFGKVLANQLMTEIPGEQVATILQDLNEWAILNPDKPFQSYLDERPSAAAQTLIATMVATGGQVSIAKAADQLAAGPRHQRAVEILTALKDGTVNSKTFARAPERVREFIAKHTANGPLENIFIPAEQMARYFQDMQIDPAAAAAEMGAKNFGEAMATGGDVVIPLADFIASTAKTPHYDGLLADIRFAQGEMTQREADLFEANHPDEIQQLIAQAQGMQAAPVEGIERAIAEITADIEGQLRAGGQDPGSAQTQAQVMRAMAIMASRAYPERDPYEVTRELFDRYGLTINRPMPDILASLKRSDIQIDPLLDRMRSGDLPTDAEIFGPSLTEFIRSIGGMRDDGGELRRMEVDAQNTAFMRNLIQAGGRAVDEITALAREAGYPVDDILDAIDQEMQGQPVYADGNLDEFLLSLRETVNDLGDYLSSLGVNLNEASNEQIRELMATQVGQMYEQPAQADLLDLARLAKESGNDNRTVVVGSVQEWVAQAAAQAGVEIDGYRHTVDMYAIRHAIKKHGDEQAEAARGQIALGDADIAAIGSVVMQPDSIILGMKNARGQDQILSVKTMPDGTMLVVEEVRKGKKAVAVESVRKVPGAKNARELLPSVLLNARNDAKADPIIVDAPADANTDGNGLTPGNPDLRTLFQSAFSRFLDTRLRLGETLANQPDAVRRALRGEIKRLRNEAYDAGDPGAEMAEARMTGAQLVERITERLGSQSEAREYLAAIGVGEVLEAETVLNQSTAGSELGAQSADFLSGLPFVPRGSFPNGRDDLAVLFQSLVDGTGESAERLADLLEANAVAMQESGFVGTPTFLAVLTQMRGAILNDPQVLDAIVGSVPVDVMDNLGLSESAAKELLHNEAVNEDSSAFNADLVVSSGRDTSDSVGLLLREAASVAAKLARISLGARLKSQEGGAAEGANQGGSFSQSTSYNEDGRRAYIQFGPDRKFNIALLERADLSSFLHETGHFWLEVMGDLAEDPNSSEQLKADYAAILKFLNVESRGQIGVEQHELFARANEAYLREGKAPSVELRGVFQKFKAWLTMIYKSLEQLHVELNDEVRGVFDRIYASEAEIEAAKNELDLPALFATAADAGMTEQEFAAYSGSVAGHIERAKDELRAKLMRQFAREKQAWWHAELDKLRDEVGKEVDAQPIYQAFDALTRGELPDGTPFKLDKTALVEQFGKAYIKRLPRGYGDGRGAVYSTSSDGLHHDAAAELLGYGSGAELVEALVNLRPRKELVEAEAKQRMQERHGDMMVDGTIGDEAVAAMHNEERANILRTELLAIRKKQIEAAPFVKVEADKARAQRKQAMAATEVPPVSAFRDAARGMIGQTEVRDIKPYPYLLAERKAAKAAFAAMARGDAMEAAAQKQKELLNHYLYREATAARETVDAIYTYARKFTKTRVRAKFGKAGGPYLEQIDDLLDQYEFAPVSQTDIVRREKLLAFIKEKMEDDEPIMIPDAVLLDAQKRNYKTLPFDQLQAVRDAIANLEHLVDLKTKLLKVQAQRALEEVVEEGAASIAEHGTKKDAPVGTRTWLDSAKELRDGYFASHRKLASLFREMDGWKDDGFMWNTFMKPINDAANEKAVRTEEATLKLQALYAKLEKPGLANKARGLGLLSKDYYPSLGRSMSKADILALALNYGNEGNRQRIRDGYGWTDQQVLAALNRLEANEWDFVQGMWDLIDSYWGEIAAQDKRVNGIAPEKVERSGFILPSGRRIEGGYYPIKYDERHSVRSYQDRAKEEADRILRGAVARPGVDTGFTKDRAGKVVDRKIKLDLGVGLEHIDTVLQTLTHREVLIDLNKILGSSKINGAILDHYGIETYKAVQEAIVDIAAGEVGARDAFESGMAWLRSGVTIAGMGLNMSTALMQPLGVTQSMVRIGPKWVGRGIARFIGDAVHMENAAKFVFEKSPMMRLRSKTQNREIAEIRNKIGKGGVMPKVEEAYFYAIVKMQAAVDVPTWLGAYEKYMHQTGNDEAKAIALADQAVIDAQGGGQTKDLAGIQRGGPLKKLFTTFYSYFSATWNLTVESAGRTDFKKVGDVGRFAVDMLLLYTLPVVLTGLLKEALKGNGGPDDDEEWYAWLAREQLSFMAGTLVGPRELSSAIEGMFGYSGPAGARFFAESSKLVKQAGQGEADVALAKAANNTIGMLFHLPAGQIQRTAEGVLDLKDGTTRNPGVLLFGSRKDE
jgi:hypothetical protein